MKHSSTQYVGQVFDGRYKILEELGSGGMGSVFRAEHIGIGRMVAIKVLNPELAGSSDFAKRFEREAEVAGRLTHPNCVPVTDFGSLEDNTRYIVMELVAGQSLGELLKSEGRLSVERALRISRHILRGLSHAHGTGIVHRDIKPDNVMLVERGDYPDFARVLDFGIAALQDDGGEKLTQVGTAIGTPGYLSPEQAVGQGVDERSDIYSTCVVLFQMLCGRPPFLGKSPVEVLMKHAAEPAPKISEICADLASFPELEQLVATGLEKSPGDRFATADALISTIDTMLAGTGVTPQAVPTPPPEPSDQATRPLRPTPKVEPKPTIAPTLLVPTANVDVVEPDESAQERPDTSSSNQTQAPARVPGSKNRRLALASAALVVVAGLLFVTLRGGKRDSAQDGNAEKAEEPAAVGQQTLTGTEKKLALKIGQPEPGLTGLDEVEELIDRKAIAKASRALDRLRRKHPESAYLAYLQGTLYMDRSYWQDGFAAYRDAISNNSEYREHPRLIQDAIRGLFSVSKPRLAVVFLRDAVGAPARPALERALAATKNPKVKTRMRSLLDKIP